MRLRPIIAVAFATLVTSTFTTAVSPAHAQRVRQTADTATFAGGCFWSMEAVFDDLPGVISATAGYSGGTVKNPSYELVETGSTGHIETVQVIYDPSKITYAQLLTAFWHNVDPLDATGQFCDHGPTYRSQIFYHDAAQLQLAESTKAANAKHFTRPIVTKIVQAGPFYPAEEYHQKFAKKNPGHYGAYRAGCGRDRRLRELWGDQAGGHQS